MSNLWEPITANNRIYDLSHLHPSTVIAGHKETAVNITFSFHVFTDEKERGPKITVNEEVRYFSEPRYQSSHEVANFAQNRIFSSYTRAFTSKNGGQQFFFLEDNSLAIFAAVQKSDAAENTLNIRIVSGYEIEQWGRSSLPTHGKLLKMSFVMDKRLNGEIIKT